MLEGNSRIQGQRRGKKEEKPEPMFLFFLLALIQPSSAQMLGQIPSHSECLHVLLSVCHAAERHARLEDEVKVTLFYTLLQCLEIRK
ncbi:hypothetical protein KOW79_000173 [Hemibagrus wyckioides]|uniref:Secreted protein n=1 Tax=Hemibagrus wyckioides TaxID=337641 RepID=A0A9D3SUI7_9TELE|nr:hypothetical protein KOW79_000173 [Hemibagrus wyckioides]